MVGGGGETNLNTLNSRFYKLNNKQFARSGVQLDVEGSCLLGYLADY